MNGIKIIGEPLKNIPWQEKPEGCGSIVWRHNQNPIIPRNPTKKTGRIFNSAVVPFKEGFAGVFRADQKNMKALLHVGWSKDALHWEFSDEEIHWKDTDGNPADPYYAYDPRVIPIEDTYYIVWCTEFGGGPSLGFGTTRDFVHFTRLENICLPCNRNGVLFPRKINGKYYMLSRPSDTGHTPFGDIFISESPDLVYWGRHRKVMSRGGSGWWQGLKIGAGSVPIETTEGWLMFYHGVSSTCNGFVYSFGAALLDIDEPSRVLYRCRDYLLTPEMSYETTGFVPNVVFPCATLTDSDTGRIVIYYGAADTYVAVAYTRIDALVEFLKTNSELCPGDDKIVR